MRVKWSIVVSPVFNICIVCVSCSLYSSSISIVCIDREEIDSIVYKSTKANKGFKKAFTTSNMTYKNTKGLKKGTRYYYKVRAYKVVEGVTYYSDWSNKAFRIAK